MKDLSTTLNAITPYKAWAEKIINDVISQIEDHEEDNDCILNKGCNYFQEADSIQSIVKFLTGDCQTNIFELMGGSEPVDFACFIESYVDAFDYTMYELEIIANHDHWLLPTLKFLKYCDVSDFEILYDDYAVELKDYLKSAYQQPS